MGTYRATKWVSYAGCSVKARCGVRGLLAGCPAAFVAMSAYTATLSLRLRERQGLFHRFYLDDFTMTHFAPKSEKQARASLGNAIGVLERWAHLAGVSLNSKDLEQIRTTQQGRVSMAIARSGKIRARPWSRSERSLVVRFLVLSIANWGCELLMPTGKMVADLRVSVVRHFHVESLGRHPLMTL
eukprot:3287372-Amphidinium_carterae.1